MFAADVKIHFVPVNLFSLLLTLGLLLGKFNILRTLCGAHEVFYFYIHLTTYVIFENLMVWCTSEE
jgi:hypothetical protein